MDGNTLRCWFVFGLHILHSCCYRVPVIIRDAKTWSEAQKYCRENHHDLITINSLEEATILGHVLRDSDEQFWIGLQSNYYRFRLVAEGGLTDEKYLIYNNWMYDRPTHNKETIACAYMMPSGQWKVATWSLHLPFVCYDDSSENKYVVVSEGKSWLDAQKYCKNHHTDLVSIRNESMNDEIANLIQSDSWIGVYRLSWLWSDGQSRHINSFNNWDPEPRNVFLTCATTTRSTWTEKPRDNEYPFICSGAEAMQFNEENKISGPHSLKCNEQSN